MWGTGRLKPRTAGSQSPPCPKCGGRLSRVLKAEITRHTKRRRRVCVACGTRFTTREETAGKAQ